MCTIIINRILCLMKIASLLFVSQCFILSCATIDQKQISTDLLPNNTPLSISPEQETAFDALNKLQLKLKGQNLYSTFPGLQHDCFPPDTSFVISQAELLVAMKNLLAKYFTNYDAIQQCNKLAANAVLAQKEYLVEQCYITSTHIFNDAFKSRPVSKSGVWILPEILGRRDVILEW